MITILADDLTGAMDAAAPFAARGWAAVVLPDHEGVAPKKMPRADVLVVNLDCRHLAGRDAAARTRLTKERLGLHDISFLKIDSTLRGPIVEMIQATAKPGQPIVIAPAVPTQSRYVRNGELWVDGRPLRHSGFMHDPCAQPFSGDLAAALGPSAASMPDTENRDDLARILDDAPDSCLLVGAAGLAGALAHRLCGAVRRPPPKPQGTRALFILGSSYPSTRAQGRALRKLRPGLSILTAPEASGDPVATERRLAEAASRDIAEHRPDVLFLTGGATALSVLSRVGVRMLRIDGEVLAGLPAARTRIAGKDVFVVTKAGGFGPRRLLVDLAETLDLAPCH